MSTTPDQGDDSPTTPEPTRTAEIERVAGRGRKRLDHATATVDAVLETLDDAADDAALRRARCAIRNATGDFEEVTALAGTKGE